MTDLEISNEQKTIASLRKRAKQWETENPERAKLLAEEADRREKALPSKKPASKPESVQ